MTRDRQLAMQYSGAEAETGKWVHLQWIPLSLRHFAL